MDHSETEELARTWVKYHLLPKIERTTSPLFSAWQQLDQLVRENPEDAWNVIMAISSIDSSDWISSNLAAGPLEDLLDGHGRQFIDRVEHLAQEDDKFLRLLTGVYISEPMAAEVQNRLRAIINNTELST